MGKNNKIPVIIDTDPGVDDAVAMAIALASKKLDILLVTTGAGNVGVEQLTTNALNLLNYLKHPNIPVAKGEAKPLKRETTTSSAHGGDGIGNYSSKFPKHNLKPVDKIAHEAMAEAIAKSEQKVTIIGLGPMTNIAKLLLLHPEAKDKIDKIVIMAGSIEKVSEGQLPYTGFNVKADPEACEVVIKSGIRVVVSPMDMGHLAYLDYQDIYRTKTTNLAGVFFEQLFRNYHDHHVKNGAAMHDACAVAYCIDPSLFGVEKLHVELKYYKELKTGVLRCEWAEPRNIEVCTSCNIKKFKKLFFNALKRTKTLDD